MSSDGSLSCHIPIAGRLAKKQSEPIAKGSNPEPPGYDENALPLEYRDRWGVISGLSTPCKSKKMMDANWCDRQ